MNVSWEDTARSKNSCWGPNISDMTLTTGGRIMPVIRKPNFADVSIDFPIDKLSVLVGNENNSNLKRISLKEYLKDINKYTSNKVKPMYLDRDDKILTSSQCCILPCETDKTDFSVNLYNYQSSKSNPRVLVIVSSAKETSCQIVTGNTGLNFNRNGKEARYRVERLADDRKARNVEQTCKITEEEKQSNDLFIYQIPLLDQPGVYYKSQQIVLESCTDCTDGDDDDSYKGSSVNSYARDDFGSSKRRRGFDQGILSVGSDIGVYPSVGKLNLVRDNKYPIRLTIQHYRVTDSVDNITSDLVKEIVSDISNIYEMGLNESSLVVEKTTRTTETTNTEGKSTKSHSFFNFVKCS